MKFLVVVVQHCHTDMHIALAVYAMERPFLDQERRHWEQHKIQALSANSAGQDDKEDTQGDTEQTNSGIEQLETGIIIKVENESLQ